MSRIYFSQELETVATYWQVFRRDGFALGFTTHNRDLPFDGLLHRAAPGMLPSAIRRTAELASDAVEVEGILSHSTIAAADLRAGRYDGARIAIGLVDWETLERALLFHGEVGMLSEESERFEAELNSAKVELEKLSLPATSPTCRAAFCDRDCALNASRFTHLCRVDLVDLQDNTIAFADAPDPAQMRHGSLRWLDGPHAGLAMQVVDAAETGLTLDGLLSHDIVAGHRALLREGCDHTLQTCANRFANSVNFQGEPFLPGNDLLARYPTGSN